MSGGTDFLVNPCILFDSILGDDDKRCFLSRDKEDVWTRDEHIRVRQMFDGMAFTWEIRSPYVQDSTTLRFRREEYWTKVKNSIILFYEAMASGRETYYDGRITLDHVSRVYSQLNLTELLLMPGMKRAADVDVESFEFVCPRREENGEKRSIYIPYSIAIGNRKYDIKRP